ncbi:MAG: ABC transporter substrate-binding protein [Thermomicrobiales bacterium]|nr:ABC transporter substrate-binding protein [Thermomicrobiales bacterium]
MSFEPPMKTRVQPRDPQLAERQWAEWRASRRSLIKAGALGGAALVTAGLMPRVASVPVAYAQDAEPVLGGTITMSMADSDATSFDPPLPVDNMAIWTMLLFYDQLVRANADGTAVEPGLAESWSADETGTQYTFNLRDAVFHDGSPVKASDVVFSLMRLKNLEDGPWGFIYVAVESVEAPDDKTVLVNLSQPWAPLEADLAMFCASIIPQALVEEQGDDFFQHPVGSGAFKFVSWEKDQEIVLEKNSDWWDTGKPYLDGITFKVLPDSNARMLQFQGGDLDIATSVPFNQLDGLKANPDVQIVSDSAARFDQILFNTRVAPLDDIKVRQAINYAIDKQAIIDNVLFGNAEVANSFLPKMSGHDDALPPYSYDIEKAKELLVGTAAENGFDLEMIVGAGDSVDVQVAQLVAAALAEIGGKITISQLDGASALDAVYGPDHAFQMSKSYYTTDIIDPDEITAFVAGSDGAIAAAANFSDPKVDELVKASQTEFDPAKRQEIYNEIQKLVQEAAYMVYLYYPSGATAVQSAIQNFHISPTGNYRLYEVWRTDV